MAIDNFKLFEKIFSLKENEFYFVQIIQRSKDDNSVTSSNNRYRRVKSYYISSIDEYHRFIPEIIKFCENNNARAYIRVTPVSFYDVAVSTAEEYIRRIKEKQTFKSCSIYDSCCEKVKSSHSKVWMIDVDICSSFDELSTTIEKITSSGSRVRLILPTKNGYHILVDPFDIRKWDNKYGEIKKNNPITLLYYNDLSSKSK